MESKTLQLNLFLIALSSQAYSQVGKLTVGSQAGLLECFLIRLTVHHMWSLLFTICIVSLLNQQEASSSSFAAAKIIFLLKGFQWYSILPCQKVWVSTSLSPVRLPTSPPSYSPPVTSTLIKKYHSFSLLSLSFYRCFIGQFMLFQKPRTSSHLPSVKTSFLLH